MVQLYLPPPSALSSSFSFISPFLFLSNYFFLLSNNKRTLAFTPALLPDRKEIPYGHLGLVTAVKTRGNPAAFVDPEVRYDSNQKNGFG
ncbi:leukotriene-b omega-hydroxylase 1-like protein [Lasius niger]|uniref:Leukotriene-b omega-hydroxylase 1-like protein n=1 Tax=Lasius niger TaxID=67767 RepID=A0A0J7KVJ3_LASNI|nr:leukotriene-b omega-hydroxylase 1-like protein [Lasius niger]